MFNKLMKFRKFNSKRSLVFSKDSNLKYYIINGILFTIMASLSRTFAMKFLFRIGGNSFYAALYNALAGLIAIFATLPGIIWINKTNNKKQMMGKFFVCSRSFTLLFALVPFLPSAFQPAIFIILYSLMNFPETISVTAFQSFAGDIFLPEERSTAISLKNKFSTLAQIISMLLLGLILTSIGKNSGAIIPTYQILFVFAFIVGLMEIKTFYKLKETSKDMERHKIDFKTSINNMKHNKKFKSFMICSLLFHFGWQMGWPLFDTYQIQYLKANELWITILGITSSLVMFFSFSYWNRNIKRYGNGKVIAVTTLGMAGTPILFALSPNLYVLTFVGLVTGFFTSGTITVIFSSLLEVVPEKERLLYVGTHATLTNITLTIAPMIGQRILTHSSIYVALVTSACFRLIGSIAFFIRNRKEK